MNTATKLLKAPKTILLIMALLAGIITEGTTSSKQDVDQVNATPTLLEKGRLPQAVKGESPHTSSEDSEGNSLVLDNSEY